MSCMFPDICKIVKIIPLHKKECKLNFQNYRLISLLICLLIFTKQLGFHNNYSPNHALISITERIKDLVDSGNFVCGVFVDLEKAFNTVNHKLLCDKLNYYGLPLYNPTFQTGNNLFLQMAMIPY